MADVTSTAPLVDAYKSPYTEDVLGSALKKLNDQGQQRRNELGTEAFGAGAYGDARHGVESASLTKDLASAAGDLTATVNSDAWDKAMGWLNTDLDRQTSTAFNNANLENQWYSNQLSGLSLEQQLEQMGISNAQSYADALLGLDQYDRGVTQDELNTEYSDWLESRDWDKNQLTDWMSLITGTPSSSTESTSNSWLSSLAAALGGIKTTDGASLFG